MVSVTAQVDKAELDALSALLGRVAKETPRRAATEVRRAALYLCKSLAARTKVAPKRMREGEYSADRTDIEPRYITNRNGQLLRRWILVRRLGTPQKYTRLYYVHSKAEREGNHMRGGSRAEEKRELVKVHGGIQNRGLAKKSWGWIAQQIYATGATGGDLSFKLGKTAVRDPREFVSGVFSKSRGGASASLNNRLDYIADALQEGALNDSLRAATNRLRHNIEHQIERAMK